MSFLASDLLPMARIALTGRTDEDQAVLGTGLGEFLVLREEAVAGMDGLGAGLASAAAMILSTTR
jgi:hypothetical protein